jgi:DcmR-like sensory protein
MAAPIRFAGSDLRDYRHVRAFFQTPDDEYRTLVPFMRDGSEHGDREVHVVPRDRRAHVARLHDAGIDVDGAQSNDQLEVLKSEDTYLENGRFDQERMLALMVILGGVLEENSFFMPPDEFLREVRERTAAADRGRPRVQ